MNSSALYLLLFWPALLVFGILYFSRRATKSLADVEDKKPGLVATIVYYTSKWMTLLLFVGFVVPYVLMSWPPRWLERRDQRKEVLKRVESAGGWGEVLRQSSMFLSTNTDPRPGFIVPWAQTNFALPPAMKALKPRYIALDSFGGVSAVKMHVFGVHSSGHRDRAFYSLVIMPDAPKTNVVELLGRRYGERQKTHQITNGVFEVY
jgi:hypothetical protein